MAGLIPQDTIDEILSRSDIVEIVGAYVNLRKRGRNWFGLCPFHQEDTASFSVNEEKQIYKCFGCGKGGNVISFLMEIEHLTFGEAARKLAERCGVTIPETELSAPEQARRQQRSALLAIHEQAAAFYRQQLTTHAAAQAYLKKRGVSEEIAARFGLGAAPEADWQALYDHLHRAGFSDALLLESGLVSRSAKNGRFFDKFHGRLIFPIRDARGSVVAFGGRVLGEGEPKYLNSQTTPIYNKSQLLYALDVAGDAIRRAKSAVVMEGYMDVLTAHQFGVENAVASLGTAFTDNQARLLNRYAPPAPEQLQVILAFDGDGAGVKAALQSLDKLCGYDFVELRALTFPEQLDPDDFFRRYGERGWRRLLDRYLLPRLDYLLQRAERRHDAATAAGKGEIVAELLPALLKTPNVTERDGFIRNLAARLNVSPDAIRADLARGGREAAATRQSAQRLTRPVRPAQEDPLHEDLLALAIADRDIFTQARAELGDDMATTAAGRDLVQLIEQCGDDYCFVPNRLFSQLGEENEGLRQLLLKLIEVEIPEQPRLIAADCIARIKKQKQARALAALQQQISAAEARGEDVTALVEEKLRLSREIKGL